MKISAQNDTILGLMATGRSVHAVLIKDGPEGPEILRRFTRQRATSYASTEAAPKSAPTEIQDDAAIGDFTIQFGSGGGSSSDLFLSSEFAGLEGVSKEDSGSNNIKQPVIPFDLELIDILSECSDLGHPEPLVAFCSSSSDVSTVEFAVSADALKGKGKGKGKGKDKEKDKDRDKGKKDADVSSEIVKDLTREQLLTVLSEEQETKLDDERIAFIPMVPSDNGAARYLAVIGRSNDAVSSTLTSIRSRKMRLPAVRLLDNEIPIYVGLARAAYYLATSDAAYTETPGDDFAPTFDHGPRKTLVVRAGIEDTLVLFMQDDQLQHYESLRSITTYDAPETICSRVLLLQDEYGIGDVEHVLLLSDDREDAIVESFRMFFADTRVESIRRYLPKLDDEDSEIEASSVPVLALGAALRMVRDQLYQGAFEDVNLLPKKLLRRKIKLPVTWHIFALYGFMFVTVLFFVGRYFATQSEVNEYRAKISEYPADYTELDSRVLQARVDSFNAVAAGYKRAIDVLDSLLVGSDKWSRAMATTATSAANVQGVWIDRWQPEGGSLSITGNATSRDRVVRLAENLNADIESVTFSEIRDWPVYRFNMKVPIATELPAAARYLRERVATDTKATSPGVQGTN